MRLESGTNHGDNIEFTGLLPDLERERAELIAELKRVGTLQSNIKKYYLDAGGQLRPQEQKTSKQNTVNPSKPTRAEKAR